LLKEVTLQVLKPMSALMIHVRGHRDGWAPKAGGIPG